MSRAVSILLAVIVAGGALGFFFVQAIRAPQGVTSVTPVRSDILESETAQQLQQREVNGQVPVQVIPDQFGRDDPFAEY